MCKFSPTCVGWLRKRKSNPSSMWQTLGLVASPDQCRNLGQRLDNPRRDVGVGRQPGRTFDSGAEVGYRAVEPAADLVAKDAQTPSRAKPHRPGGDNPASGTVTVWNGRMLDREPALR